MKELTVDQALDKERFPSLVEDALVKFTKDQKWGFIEEFYRREKDMACAYVFWVLFGLHYAYLGKWGMQLLFWLTAAGLGVWWFIDLFRIPGLVRNYNADVSINVLRDIKTLTN